jgi:hypothetical protein
MEDKALPNQKYVSSLHLEVVASVMYALHAQLFWTAHGLSYIPKRSVKRGEKNPKYLQDQKNISSLQRVSQLVEEEWIQAIDIKYMATIHDVPATI